jgi:acetyl-CoA C-acetyltransferase
MTGLRPGTADVVIVDAVRSPIGRRNGGLAHMHAADLLAAVLNALLERTGLDPAEVGQIVGGCVDQVGMQSGNIVRLAALAGGLPAAVPASTVTVQCGASQQAHTIAHGLIAGGITDVAIACGVENMSAVPMGSTVPSEPDVGHPQTASLLERYDIVNQFAAADRIAELWGISRADADAFGVRSQDLAAQAWAEGRFDAQLVAIEAPAHDDVRTVRVDRDEGLRDSDVATLAGLRTTSEAPNALHTAATSSQIADGAAAVLLMAAERAAQLGLRPLARVVDSCLVGGDPELKLTGPIPATRQLLSRTGLSLSEIDVFEVNEAFASVVLAWQQELDVPHPERVNPNGGAIALGHPLGATGAVLLTKAVHELQRTGGRHALVTMCCSGGLGTGSLLRRI